MPLALAPWLLAGLIVLAQASNIIGKVGSAITGIDNAVTATVDLKKIFNKVVIAPIQQIQPVVIPSSPKKMPTKAPVKQ